MQNNELKGGLNALRGVCLRRFPELSTDVKIGAIGKGADTATGLRFDRASPLHCAAKTIADLDVQTVQWMEHVPEVVEAVGSTLLSLGDGNWRMVYSYPTPIDAHPLRICAIKPPPPPSTCGVLCHAESIHPSSTHVHRPPYSELYPHPQPLAEIQEGHRIMVAHKAHATKGLWISR